MNGFARSIVVTIVSLSLVLTTGCSSGPSRQEVRERFLIEFKAEMGVGTDDDWAEVADGAVDDAFDGMCGNGAYLSAVSESPSYVYAFNVTCLFYFENDMSEAQRSAVKQEMIDRATS